MIVDALLAYLHWISIFLLIVFLTAETVLLRPDMTPDHVRRLGFYDLFYGISALLVLASGLARVVWGVKGLDFYLHNPVFLAKVCLFVIIGLLSIKPTLTILRWRRQRHAVPLFVPGAAEIARMRRWAMLEAHLLILIPFAAALMARGVGL